MVDIVERLRDRLSIKACTQKTHLHPLDWDQGRATLEEAAAEITRLRAEVERLTDMNAKLVSSVFVARAEERERAAQIAENWEKTMQPGMLLDHAFREVAHAIRASKDAGGRE